MNTVVMWSKREKEIARRVFKTALLIPIFGRLIRERWIRLDELEGLDEDKLAKIKIFADLE